MKKYVLYNASTNEVFVPQIYETRQAAMDEICDDRLPDVIAVEINIPCGDHWEIVDIEELLNIQDPLDGVEE